MTRQSLLVLLALPLAVAACATSHHGWEKSGDMSAVQQDKAQCEYEAKAATASYKSTPSKPGETAAMGAAVGDGIVIAEKQIELTNQCMRARGYVPKR
jgi:hypothetical protein